MIISTRSSRVAYLSSQVNLEFIMVAQHRCAVPLWCFVMPTSSFFIVVSLVFPNKL